ncbi:MAG TPA: VWA domain-containing protein [Candidatus Hydrogenedentes bacterium]|nr:VWA domain-containing protein [Candidatus Hydrogenedentota bacterium]
MNQWEQLARNTGTALRGAFIDPVYLWFLAVIPVIVILYLLKLRRTQVVIASTILWRKALDDLTANAPFQRLRKNLLLLLQILIALAVALALARPFFKSEGTAGQNLCVLIDRSASMQAQEAGESRLDLAKQAAIAMVNDMERGDRMMVVTFAENSEVLCELSDDRSRLRSAINAIEASDARTHLRDAYFIAESLRLTVPDLHAVVIGDGNISDLADFSPRGSGQTDSAEGQTGGITLSYLKIGGTTENVGITAFSKRDPAPGEAGEQQALVVLQNAGTEARAVTVTLSFADQPIAVEGVEIAAGEDREVVFALPDLGEGILSAVLDNDDALAVDNTAWLSLRPAAKLRVLLVARPDATSTYFLQRVLSPDPRVELSTIAPESYTPTDDYDLIVFNDFSPEQLPDGTLLFLNALPPIDGLTGEGVIENPPVISVDSEHPLMRFNLNPANVGIRAAVKASLPAGARAVVSTTGGTLIGDLSRGGQQIAWVAFDLANSNWPLNLSFPLFFQNVLAWTPRSALASESSIDAGKSITLLAQPEIAEAVVTRPDGATATVKLDPLRPTFYGDTLRAGVYAAQMGERRELFAVNLLDPNESAIRPEEALALGGAELKAERGSVRQNREVWRLLIAAALCVLALEWWIFSRRAWM